MNINELQIGNIFYRHCCNDRVVEIRKDGVIGLDNLRGIIPFNEIEPILITKEFLLENGFEEKYEDITKSFYYEKDINNVYIMMSFLEYSNLGDDYFLFHVDNCDMDTIMRTYIKYIHQMQNLLNIVGIEDDLK